MFFLYFFGLWTEKLQTFTENFWREFRKTFYVSRRLLTEQLFQKTVFKVLGSKEYEWKFTDSGENFFQGCQYCNKCPEEPIKEKHFGIVQKIAIASKILNKLFFQIFGEKFGPSCHNLQSTYPWEILSKTFFQDSDKVSNFFGLAAKYKRPLFDKFSLGWHNCHPRFQMNFLRKIISFSTEFSKFSSFLEFEQFLCFSAKNIVKFVKNAFSVHTWRNSKESISEKKWFLYLFRTLNKKGQIFTRKFGLNLEKHSTCQD